MIGDNMTVFGAIGTVGVGVWPVKSCPTIGKIGSLYMICFLQMVSVAPLVGCAIVGTSCKSYGDGVTIKQDRFTV